MSPTGQPSCSTSCSSCKPSIKSGLPTANYLEFRSRQRNRGARGKREPREIRGHEEYKVKPKQNHCHGHTPQAQKGPYPRIQKGLKHPTLAWNEIRFVTILHRQHGQYYTDSMVNTLQQLTLHGQHGEHPSTVNTTQTAWSTLLRLHGQHYTDSMVNTTQTAR